jgi:hypothetical protein
MHVCVCARVRHRDELRALFRVAPHVECDTHTAIKCRCCGDGKNYGQEVGQGRVCACASGCCYRRWAGGDDVEPFFSCLTARALRPQTNTYLCMYTTQCVPLYVYHPTCASVCIPPNMCLCMYTTQHVPLYVYRPACASLCMYTTQCVPLFKCHICALVYRWGPLPTASLHGRM